MAFSKIRREVQNLAEELTRYLRANDRIASFKLHQISTDVIRDERSLVSHDDVVRALIGTADDVKAFLSPIYDDVRLTQWFFRLRRALTSTGGGASQDVLREKVPAMIEASKARTRWQVLRLYRARNHLAHGASRTLWLSDLARHANYLLTNTIAICLNYANAPNVSARSILDHRSGRLDAYLTLVRGGDAKALSVDGLLKPSRLFES